jgi:hypothetical protein
VIQVFSSGGGTQSCAIAALIVQGKLPKPDFVVIADTGREAPSTWEYLDAVVRPALASVGVEIHRLKKEEYGEAGCLGDYSKKGEGDLLIPAFSTLTGQPSKMSNFCTDKWKVVVVNNYLSRVHGLTRSKYVKWIGFSFDESRRWLRMQRGAEFDRGLIRFPLVELRMIRHESIALVERMGWPKPPRSRCWMCPNQSDYEWAEVKTDWPDKFAEAIALDESIRQRDPHAFIHSSVKPLRDANLDKPDDLFSGSCPSGECFL